MGLPQLALHDLPLFFSFDSYVRDLAYNHADAPLLAVKVSPSHLPQKSFLTHNLLIVQTCGDCSICEPEAYQLVKIGELYTVKRKKAFSVLQRRANLHIAGRDPHFFFEPIGRVIGWLQG